MFTKLKKSWQEFLARLTRENEKQFGTKRPDCCDLNNPSNGEKNKEECDES
ncbi:MAG: hypothetical protein HQ534_09250 [Armatimonadetes bacterium]|nr:hypothetical protein [Armatimonadota bacterium]